MFSGEIATVVFGLASALSWGACHFSDGLASKRSATPYPQAQVGPARVEVSFSREDGVALAPAYLEEFERVYAQAQAPGRCW